uniref:Uncharacterized protein n=1 Tax=Siphoviridae sp. ctuvC1 TaxID=2826507 RepID=A0A8S5LZV8_9CAUD|nr:MAG TPA: Protein of unknown function (DUF1356) [Siphoviridae sp. ctuvC1]
MARQTIKTRTVTHRRVRKTGGNSGYKKCPTCKGSGRVKSR